MSKQWEKYIQKLTKKEKEKILSILNLIFSNKLNNLDIKELQGVNNNFRCRIWKHRIIFEKISNKIKIIQINNRGNI